MVDEPFKKAGNRVVVDNLIQRQQLEGSAIASQGLSPKGQAAILFVNFNHPDQGRLTHPEQFTRYDQFHEP